MFRLDQIKNLNIRLLNAVIQEADTLKYFQLRHEM